MLLRERWEAEFNNNSSNRGEAEENENEMDPVEQLFAKRRKVLTQLGLEREFEEYEALPQVSLEIDRLVWCAEHSKQFPILSSVARDVLGVPCTSSKSERIFSSAGLHGSALRTRLNPNKLEDLTSDNRELLEQYPNLSEDMTKKALQSIKVVKVQETVARVSAVFDEDDSDDEADKSLDTTTEDEETEAESEDSDAKDANVSDD